VIKKVAYEPTFLAHLRDQLSIKGVTRVVMHERLTKSSSRDLRAICAGDAQDGSLARPLWRGESAGRMRQGGDRP